MHHFTIAPFHHHQVRHDNEEQTKVDGFQEPGSFRQEIFYQVEPSTN